MDQTVFFDSVLFYDEFTDTGGGGVRYPNFRVLDKGKCVERVYFKWGTYGKSLVWSAADKTITRSDGGNFVENGWKAGDDLTPEDTVVNTGDFTIVSVTPTVITVNEAVGEEVVVCNIHGMTPITNVEKLYNIISNSSSPDFFSPIDTVSKCHFYKNGLDCTDTTPVNMIATGRSQAWNNTLSITIQGDGDDDYAQAFIITHTFRVSPYWLAGQDTLFDNVTPPSYFNMKYVSQVQSSFDETNPNPDHSYVYDAAGRIGWFNESERGSSNYSKTSIVCDSDIFDLNIEQNWTAILASQDLFGAGSKIVIYFFLCPSSEDAYKYTTTNQQKNFALDYKYIPVDTMNNGENFGTDYQVFEDIDCQLTSSSVITVDFKINLSTYLKNLLKARSAQDRKFAIAITTQAPGITTTAETDRACVLFEFENFGYNQDDANGIELVDYIRCFQYPNRGTEPKNNFVLYPNEPAYGEVPFRVKLNETLVSSSVQIVAVKDGSDDYVLEEKPFGTENIRSLDGAQTIDMVESRGLKTYVGDYYNETYIKRRPVWDTETKFGLIFHYSFVARYEDWLTLIPLSDAQGIDVARSIESLTQFWYNFTQSGWSLKFRWNATKKDANGIETSYKAETSITMAAYNEISQPGGASATIQFYDEDDVEVDCIIAGGITKIKSTINGNFVEPVSGFTVPTGFVRVDERTNGVVTSSRVASPEWDGEADSPFSAEGIDADGAAIDSYASANCRIDRFENKIVLSAYYDDEVDNWSRRPGSVMIILPTLKYKGSQTDCTIDYENTGIPILQETNLALLAEDCP